MKQVHKIPLRAVMMAAALITAAIFAPDSGRGQSIIEEWASVKVPPPPEVKAVKVDAKKSALLLMDFNRVSCVAERRARCAAALPKLQKLLAAARAHGMLVVHTTSRSTTEKHISKELAAIEGERVFTAGLDKFYGTELEKTISPCSGIHASPTRLLTTFVSEAGLYLAKKISRNSAMSFLNSSSVGFSIKTTLADTFSASLMAG